MARKFVTYCSCLALLHLTVFCSFVRAEFITTESLLNSQHQIESRKRVALLLSREEIRSELLRYGVEIAEVQQRVDALSDQEIDSLVRKLDSLPAGRGLGGIVGAILLVFLVLVFTDIVGWTKVFPFTRTMR